MAHTLTPDRARTLACDARRARHAARLAWRRLARGGVTPPCDPRTPLGRLARLLGAVARVHAGVVSLARLGDAMACVGHGVTARRATVTPYAPPTDPTVARLLARGVAVGPCEAGRAWRMAGLDAWREWRTGRLAIDAVISGGWAGGRGLQCSIRALALRPDAVRALVACGALSADDATWIAERVTVGDDGKIRTDPQAGPAWGVRAGLVDAPPVRAVTPAPRGPRAVVVTWHGIPGGAPHGTRAPTGCPETLAGARREARAGCVAKADARYQAQRDDADAKQRKRAKHNAGRGKWHKTGGYSAG